MSSAAAVAINVVGAIIIQGMQAWIAAGRAMGQTEEQIDAAYNAAKSMFILKTPDKLPDA